MQFQQTIPGVRVGGKPLTTIGAFLLNSGCPEETTGSAAVDHDLALDMKFGVVSDPSPRKADDVPELFCFAGGGRLAMSPHAEFHRRGGVIVL